MQGSIDREDASRFDGNPDGQKWERGWYVLLGLTLILVIFVIHRWRLRSSSVLLFAMILLAAGCGSDRKPVILLRASLDNSKLISPRKTAPIKLRLRVRNDGTVPIKILRVDGGCSCRQVDQSSLPLVLENNDESTFIVTAQVDPQFSPRPLSFGFETDHGLLVTSVNLLVVPAHHVEPEFIANSNLFGDQTWEFEFKHTEVSKTVNFPDEVSLALPRNLSIVSTNPPSNPVEVEGFPGVFQRDTVYKIRDNNLQLGLSRVIVKLVDSSQIGLLEIPIVTRRSAYVSSSPDRVYLSDRPFRVFLRCPDTSIEFTSVFSSPPGVKAYVSSPHEVTVVALSPATQSITGVIKVGTTASTHPPLEIPVVKYASSVSGMLGEER